MLDEKLINDIVWWIPIKKLRNNIRSYLLEFINLNIKVDNIEHNIINNYSDILNKIKKLTPKTHIDYIEIHLAEHCNFSCYSCTHFSQLAKEDYYDIEEFEKDIRRLFELTDGLVNKFHLMGGEPLLNKDCHKYFYIMRKYFKHSSLWLITNGILLDKQKDNFWESCKENNVEIHPTKYPINIDWQYIKNICINYNIPLIFFNNSDVIKESRKNIFDLNGNLDSFDNFMNCMLASNCIALNHGKIFLCGVSSNINHFNKYFNTDLKISENDYVDIYKVTSYKEILDFLSRPIPFCRYCDVKRWHSIGKWCSSKRSIDEYIDN